MRVFIRPPPAAVATHTESPSTATPYTTSFGSPLLSWVKLSKRPAEYRLSPPMVADPNVARPLVRRDEQDGPVGQSVGGVKTRHLPFWYRPRPFSVAAQTRSPSTQTLNT